jgi:hypothetical protein
MLIYSCNPDGSKDLIESTPIISGQTSANIELLLQAYSYEVIIDGEVYTNEEGFSACHVESETERTYYVDIEEQTTSQYIGLLSIPCDLEKTSNNTVKMTWSSNPEAGGYVIGCIKAYRGSNIGNVKVFDNCSNQTIHGYEYEVGIPINGYTYTVYGELTQNDSTVVCADEVVFHTSDSAADSFGLDALLAVFFLVAGMGLLWAGNGELQLVGAGIGFVLSWLIGLTLLPWYTTSLIIVFVVVIIIVGRQSRQ